MPEGRSFLEEALALFNRFLFIHSDSFIHFLLNRFFFLFVSSFSLACGAAVDFSWVSCALLMHISARSNFPKKRRWIKSPGYRVLPLPNGRLVLCPFSRGCGEGS